MINEEEKQAILGHIRRYEADMHAVQSGVKMEIEMLGEAAAAADAKHLRTGVNAAMIDAGSLGALLIKKGLITELEYRESLALMTAQEKERYEERLTAKLGAKVTLA